MSGCSGRRGRWGGSRVRWTGSPRPAAGPRRSSPTPPGSRSRRSGTWFLMSRWGRALPRRSTSALPVLRGPWEPHAVGAMPKGPAPQVPRGAPVPSALWWLPGLWLSQPRAVCCLVCRVLGAQSSPAVGSSATSLALWEGAGWKDSPHGCPRARRAEGVLTPVPTPGPYLLPSPGAPQLHPLLPPLGAEPPSPAAVWGPRQSTAANAGAPVARVLSVRAPLWVCSLRRCCKHPTISDYISGRSSRAEDSVIPAGPPEQRLYPSHLRRASSKHRSSGER